MEFSSITPLFWKTSVGWRNPLLKTEAQINLMRSSLFCVTCAIKVRLWQEPVTALIHTPNTTISWPLQALIAEAMSEAARKSVIAMLVETLLWWMLQSDVVCDHWRPERIYWWQWIDFTPLVSETTSVLLFAVTCSWPLQQTVYSLCLCEKGGWKTEKVAQLISPVVRGHIGN